MICLSAEGEFLGGRKVTHMVGFDSHDPANKKHIGFPVTHLVETGESPKVS